LPEGDTVHLTARRMHDALAGEVLTKSDFRVPRYAELDLAGRRVQEVVARGKHLLVRLDDDLTIHSHFKMEGALHLLRPGEHLPGPTHEVRLVLETEGRVAAGMRLGALDVVPRGREDDVVGPLGPDLLGPDWDAGEAVRRLSAQRDVPVATALLDQRNLAGIGNVYKCELCFLRGLHPLTPVELVPDLPGLVALARRVLWANRDHARHVTTGDLRPGRRHWVYGRKARPCLRCGTTIRKDGWGPVGEERVTYWCPSCQPAHELPLRG